MVRAQDDVVSELSPVAVARGVRRSDCWPIAAGGARSAVYYRLVAVPPFLAAITASRCQPYLVSSLACITLLRAVVFKEGPVGAMEAQQMGVFVRI